MIFTPLPKEEIASNWAWLSHVLKPSIDRDPGNTIDDVKFALVNGPDMVMIVSGQAKGVIVFEVTPDAECWVKHAAGSIVGGPKKRLRLILDAIAWIERAAANAGCISVNVCGRDWRKILLLTGYELMPDWPNGLRKMLTMKEAA